MFVKQLLNFQHFVSKNCNKNDAKKKIRVLKKSCCWAGL